MKSSSKDSLLGAKISVVNIGLVIFADALREQGVEVVQVTWSPPAGGDVRLMALLDELQP